MSHDDIPSARAIAARRHDEILKRLATDGHISVEEMAARFAVSRETIRRDLKALAGLGQLAIVHGGATRRSDEPALAVRREDNPLGKAAIGRAAARLVEDGMVVLLDSGSTTLAVAQALAARGLTAGQGLTVCTNSLSIGLVLCRVPGIRLHLLGGEVNGSDEAAFGTEGIAATSPSSGSAASPYPATLPISRCCPRSCARRCSVRPNADSSSSIARSSAV